MSVSATGSSGHPARVLVATLCATVLLALTCNLVIELVQVGGDTAALRQSALGDGFGLYLLGSLVIWLVVLVVLAVLGRLWLTTGLLVCASVLIGFANHQKMQLRLEPLYPSDWAMGTHVGFLVQMLGLGPAVTLALLLVACLAGCLLLGRASSRVFPPVARSAPPRLATGLVVSRVATILVCALALGYVTGFNEPGNRFRAAYESQGAHWRSWHQKQNYLSNGFVGGVLYNLHVPAMTAPAGYSRARMEQITRRYAAVARRVNRQRSPDALADVNVVLVLSETFSDPTRIEGVTLAEDPIPFTRGLMARTTSGQMLAHQFGGGTANMEFEVLTGMSLSQFQPQMSTPYQMLVPAYAQFPSAVGFFRHHGHRTVAIHPFTTSMYQRERVYPTFGFEEFVNDETMRSARRLTPDSFVSDASAFDEVRHQIAVNEAPLLVNLVTMQNHFPMAGTYPDPIDVKGSSGEPREHAEHYARGLRHTDAALERLIGSLDRSEEKTVLLFYGDHLPMFWPEETRQENGARTMRETPFLVWSNFAGPRARPLPTTSPVHFMNHVLETADAEVPPFYALLGELEKVVPAMSHGLVVGTDDELVAEADLSSRARELIGDYRLVQYDLSVGERYSQQAMFYPATESVSASHPPE